MSPSSQTSPAFTVSGSYVPISSKLQHHQLASSPHISALGILPIPFPQLPPISTTEAWNSELSSHLIQPTLHGNSVCSSSLEVSRPCNSVLPSTSYPTDTRDSTAPCPGLHVHFPLRYHFSFTCPSNMEHYPNFFSSFCLLDFNFTSNSTWIQPWHTNLNTLQMKDTVFSNSCPCPLYLKIRCLSHC